MCVTSVPEAQFWPVTLYEQLFSSYIPVCDTCSGKPQKGLKHYKGKTTYICFTSVAKTQTAIRVLLRSTIAHP